MTVEELLAIDPEDNKKKWRKNLTAVINNVNYKNDNKLVELTLADDTGEIKIALWKFKYQSEEKNEYWRMYEDGEKVKVTNAVIKAGYNGGDNELSLMKDGTVKVLGTAAIPDRPPEEPESLDDLIERNTEKKPTLKVKNDPVKPIREESAILTVNGFPIEKFDQLIDAVNNIPLSIGVLQKEMNMQIDKATTKILQQFKEFMSKFIKK